MRKNNKNETHLHYTKQYLLASRHFDKFKTKLKILEIYYKKYLIKSLKYAIKNEVVSSENIKHRIKRV